MFESINQNALKSLSCFAAVTFFSLSHFCTYECFISNDVMSILYFTSTIAKPLFFLLMGYIDEVEKISKKELYSKIRSIIFIIIFWNLILSVINTPYVNMSYILQNGILLGMVIIYISYPLILSCIKKWKVAVLVSAVLIFSLNAFYVFGDFDRNNDPIYISSYYSIWIWACYYVIGHILGEPKGRKFTKKRNIVISAKLFLIPIAVSLYFFDRYLSINIHARFVGWFLLEHLHLLCLCLALFIVFDNIKIKNRLVIRLVEFISPAMVGIYIVHNSVFFIVNAFYNFNDAIFKITFSIIVFIFSVLLCRLLLLNRLTEKLISF